MEQIFEFIGNHPFLFFALIVVGGLLAWNVFGSQLQGAKPLSPSEVTLLINHEDAVILDVREEGEYNNGHILDSIHIPLGQLEKKIEQLKPYQDRPMVTVCASGHRSAQACGTLKKHGFQNLHNMRGGLMAWQNASLPLSKGKKDKTGEKQKKNRKKQDVESEQDSQQAS
jgi:rhodanese-related sulfurtransferase